MLTMLPKGIDTFIDVVEGADEKLPKLETRSWILPGATKDDDERGAGLGALLDRDGRPGDDADAAYDREYADGDGGSKSVVFKSGQGSTTGLSEFCSMTSLRLSEIGDGAGATGPRAGLRRGPRDQRREHGKALYVVEKLLGAAFSGAYLTVRNGRHFAMKCLKLDPNDSRATTGPSERVERRGFLVFTDAVSGSRELSTAVDDGSLLDGEPARRVLQVGHQLAVAVHHVNAHGILHQDVKPDNCLIFFDGDDGVTVKLLDFGMARGNGAGAELRSAASTSAKAHQSSDNQLKEERTPKKSIIGGEALLDAALEDDYAKEHRDYLRGAARTRCWPAFRAVQLNPDHHAAFKGVAMAVPGAVHIGFRDFRASDAAQNVDFHIPFDHAACLDFAKACYERAARVILEDPERSTAPRGPRAAKGDLFARKHGGGAPSTDCQ
ncbi:serine/threonine kinase [Aureococcus anophagefferens]|nr:serine/threonine kinase [Aureococcus anophagefferens]